MIVDDYFAGLARKSCQGWWKSSEEYGRPAEGSLEHRLCQSCRAAEKSGRGFALLWTGISISYSKIIRELSTLHPPENLPNPWTLNFGFVLQVKDALEALLDWLRRTHRDLSADSPVHGDLDTVQMLIDQHKVSWMISVCIWDCPFGNCHTGFIIVSFCRRSSRSSKAAESKWTRSRGPDVNWLLKGTSPVWLRKSQKWALCGEKRSA